MPNPEHARTERFERLLKAADALVAQDGHANGCSFRGCNCGRVDGYKAARTEYFRVRNALLAAPVADNPEREEEK